MTKFNVRHTEFYLAAVIVIAASSLEVYAPQGFLSQSNIVRILAINLMVLFSAYVALLLSVVTNGEKLELPEDEAPKGYKPMYQLELLAATVAAQFSTSEIISTTQLEQHPISLILIVIVGYISLRINYLLIHRFAP